MEILNYLSLVDWAATAIIAITGVIVLATILVSKKITGRRGRHICRFAYVIAIVATAAVGVMMFVSSARNYDSLYGKQPSGAFAVLAVIITAIVVTYFNVMIELIRSECRYEIVTKHRHRADNADDNDDSDYEGDEDVTTAHRH